MIKEIIDIRKAANLPEKITILSIAEKTIEDPLFSGIKVASTTDIIQAREDLLDALPEYQKQGWIFSEPCYQHNDMYVARGYRLENGIKEI